MSLYFMPTHAASIKLRTHLHQRHPPRYRSTDQLTPLRTSNVQAQTHGTTLSSTSAFLERSATCQLSQAERCRPTAEQHGEEKKISSVIERERES